MSTPYNTLTASYATPVRQLGSVSQNQIQLTADDQIKESIVEQVFPQSLVSGKAGFTQAIRDGIYRDLSLGYIPDYYRERAQQDCTKANSSGTTNLQLASKASSLISVTKDSEGQNKLAIGGIAIVNVVPVVGQIISGALAAFKAVSSILAHHAQAVAQEQTILCYIIPKINDTIIALDNAIANNQISLSDAYKGMDTIYQYYIQAVQPILKESSLACNAACVEDKNIVALILYKKYQYNQEVATNPISSIENTISGTTGLSLQNSKYLLYIIAAVLAFFILKGLL